MFKTAAMDAILDVQSEPVKLFLIYILTRYYSLSFESIGLLVQEKKCRTDFKTAAMVAILDFQWE